MHLNSTDKRGKPASTTTALGVSSSIPPVPVKRGLELLGQGSFGTVYYYPTHSIVYKTIGDVYDVTLLEEYRLYNEVHRATSPGRESWSFVTPPAYRYWCPSNKAIFVADGFVSVSAMTMLARFEHSTFAFGLIPSAPLPIVEQFTESFIAPEARSQAPRIRLLRLYFGREDLPAQISAFHPGLAADLPLDIKRYTALRNSPAGGSMPDPREIAEGMGELLARLHWQVGINGRDIELVLGGKIEHGQATAQCYVLDYNQCQRWLRPQPLEHLDEPSLTFGRYADGDLNAGAKRLALIVSGQELYYPRPHQEDIYDPFKSAYLAEVSALLQGVRGDPLGWAAQIEAAARTFLSEFEALDQAKMERRARRARASRPCVS